MIDCFAKGRPQRQDYFSVLQFFIVLGVPTDMMDCGERTQKITTKRDVAAS
jgi:hypothetical protein